MPTLFPLFAQSWAILMGPNGPNWAPSKSFLAFSICSVDSLKPKNTATIQLTSQPNKTMKIESFRIWGAHVIPTLCPVVGHFDGAQVGLTWA